MDKKKVVVGLSGGVDSSVAAWLLKEQGWDVIGVTMQVWNNEGEEEPQAVTDARRVAQALEIPYHVLDFRKEFEAGVVDYFVSEYERGYTPNPCCICNRRVKWEALLDRAREFGADYVATGHYARITKLANGRYSIRNSVTAAKDQTYALYNLTQDQLSRTIMPIGEFEKSKVREMAEAAGIPVAAKQDSQDICFIPDHDYAAFIEKRTGKSYPTGNFVDEEGRILGTHRGVIHYTIGQRKGLGLTAETPLFVKELRMDTNEVVICKNEALFTDTCYISNFNCMAEGEIIPGMRAWGKIRYSHKGAACRLYPQENGWIKAVFDEPQRAMTPGQAAVFYEDDNVLGGGTIEKC